MNIRYPIYEGVYRILTFVIVVYFYMIVYEWDSLSFQVSCADWIIGTGLYQVIGIPALSLTVLSETFDVIFLQFQFSSVLLQEVCCLFYGREDRLWLE